MNGISFCYIFYIVVGKFAGLHNCQVLESTTLQHKQEGSWSGLTFYQAPPQKKYTNKYMY